MILLKLFWSFFQIGLFSFGGGYAAMPLIQNQIVEIHSWLTMNEFADVITISQMTPGPIGINAATFVGLRVYGFTGALIATAGCVLPSGIISLILAFIYYRFRNMSVMQGILKGLRPAVVAMIASAGLSLLILALWNGSFNIESTDYTAAGIFIAAFFVLRKWKANPVHVMLASGMVGLVIYGAMNI